MITFKRFVTILESTSLVNPIENHNKEIADTHKKNNNSFSHNEKARKDAKEKISADLHNNTIGKLEKKSPEEYKKVRTNLRHYSADPDKSFFKNRLKSNSTTLNKHLIDTHAGKKPEKLSSTLHKTHEAIKTHAAPAGREYHVYSGMSHNFAKSANKGDKYHTPAHISASHDHEVAVDYAQMKKKDPDGHHHVMHIHVKPHNKVLPMEGTGGRSKGLHETIIPAGTKLKYSHTTHHEAHPRSLSDASRGIKDKIAVHHFEIHKNHDE